MSGGGSQETRSTTEGWKPAMDLAQSQLVPGVRQYGQDYGQGQGLWSGSQLGAEDALVRQGQDAQMRMGQQYGQQIGNAIQGLEGFINYDPNDPINQARRDALVPSRGLPLTSSSVQR